MQNTQRFLMTAEYHLTFTNHVSCSWKNNGIFHTLGSHYVEYIPHFFIH